MMKSRAFLFFALHSLFCNSTYSYKIDQSCVDEGIEADVRNGMTSAFEMAGAARNRLTADRMDQNTVDLLSKLFAGPNRGVQDVDRAKIVDTFAQIGDRYGAEVPRDQILPHYDLTVFCNRERFEPVEGQKNIWKDKTSQVLISSAERKCGGRNFPHDLSDKLALAETWNPWRVGSELSANGLPQRYSEPTQIQICPWFVEWVKQRNIKLGRDGIASFIGKALVKMSGKGPLTFAQIDAFSLLDKVLLHEMTHGRTVFSYYEPAHGIDQEGLVDVGSPRGKTLGLIKLPAYGWSRATNLAAKADYTDWEQMPENNSDSYALFGSICKLMDDRANPRRVDDKGRIIRMT